MTRLAYLVHAYTATGAIWALLSLIAIQAGDYRRASLWLVLATFVDATDGILARFARVSRNAPLIDGARLDDIVDYMTYVLVPGVMLLHAGRMPEGWIGVAIVCGMMLASALGFSRQDAKTEDHFFTGFPSYWNIVALYVLALDVPRGATGVIVAALSVLVFVPIRFVYPTRTVTLRPLTLGLSAVWTVQILMVIWRLPDVPGWVAWTSLIFPAYYVALSLALNARRGRAAGT